MKHAQRFLLVAFFLTGFGLFSPALAEDVVGTVRSAKGHRLVLELADGRTRTIEITTETMIFGEGETGRVRRVLPNSEVRVELKDGTAYAIDIMRAPK